MKPQERSSQVKEVATSFQLKGQIEVATCYIGRDMKKGIEVLTRKMMSQPLIQVTTLRRAEQEEKDVVTWKIVGKKEISCNVELR